MNSEDCNNTLFIMTYTLNSGVKNTIPLSVSQIEEWINCYKEEKRFVATIGTEYFGLNSKLVADFKVHNKLSEHRKDVLPIQNYKKENNQDLLDKAYKTKSVVIKVDCKCGTTYTAESAFKRLSWYCSKCKSDVYLVSEQLVDTIKGKAFQMSNRL